MTNIQDILKNIKLNKKDIHWWWTPPLRIVESIEFLQNEDNNFENLRNFILDEIDFLKTEISHKKKYSPNIYSENVSISRKYELETWKKILRKISK